MDFSRLMNLAGGHVEARIVQTAVELALFDGLKESPRSAASLAASFGLDERATALLLNALVALELLDKTGDLYRLMPVSRRYLLTSAPEYLGGMIRFEAALWECWGRLPAAIRSGEPARPADMYQSDPKETESFIGAMDSLVKARGDAAAVAEAFDWSGVRTLLDVGSGPATYPIALCAGYPRLRATVFDLPDTLRITRLRVRESAMGDRIDLVAGDYRRDPVPGIYDVVFLSNIVHGEGFDENGALVRKLAQNLRPGGSIIIKDHILDSDRAHPPVGAIFSLLMLLTTAAGRCYSMDELERWFQAAGLNKTKKIDLPEPFTSSLVIATRPFA